MGTIRGISSGWIIKEVSDTATQADCRTVFLVDRGLTTGCEYKTDSAVTESFILHGQAVPIPAAK